MACGERDTRSHKHPAGPPASTNVHAAAWTLAAACVLCACVGGCLSVDCERGRSASKSVDQAGPLTAHSSRSLSGVGLDDIAERAAQMEAVRLSEGFSSTNQPSPSDLLPGGAVVQMESRRRSPDISPQEYHELGVRLYRHYCAANDSQNAMRILDGAAFWGNVPALVELGRRYAVSGRVGRGTARAYWTSAVSNGSAEAEALLSQLRELESCGTPEDTGHALEMSLEVVRKAQQAWFEEAPALSDADLVTCFGPRTNAQDRAVIRLARRMLSDCIIEHDEYGDFNTSLRTALRLCDRFLAGQGKASAP